MRKCVFDVAGIIEFERRLAERGVGLDGLMRRAGASVADAVLAVFACEEEKAFKGGSSFAGKSLRDEESLLADGRLDLRGACGACSLSRCAIRRSCGRGFPGKLPRVLIFAGIGNNGGDGWAAADALVDAGCEVSLVTPCEPSELSAEPARGEAMRVAGKASHFVNPGEDDLIGMVRKADVIVDAMLGIGFSGVVMREPLALWTRAINYASWLYGKPVVSADVPSGLNAQTGEPAVDCVKASVTVTMIACKRGLLAPGAASYVGELVNASIGVSLDEHARLVPNPRPLWDLEDYLARTFEPLAKEKERGEDAFDALRAPEPHEAAVMAAPTPLRPNAVAPCPPGPPSADLEAQAPSKRRKLWDKKERRLASMCDEAPCVKVTRESSAYGGSLADVLDGLDEPFSALLMKLIDERGMTDVEVYKRAGMSRQLFSKIRSSADYRPTKKTVVALAVALRLSLEETQVLLERAGFALSHSSKADVIVEYHIVNGIYDVIAINEALYSFDQPLL